MSDPRIHTHRDTQPWHTFEGRDPIWPRDLIRWNYLVAPETGSGEFEMGICRLDSGGVHVLHHHVHRSELYYVTAGTATVTVGDEEFRARPGSAFYIPRGTPHGFVNDGEEVFEIVFVYDVPAGMTRPDTFWDA